LIFSFFIDCNSFSFKGLFSLSGSGNSIGGFFGRGKDGGCWPDVQHLSSQFWWLESRGIYRLRQPTWLISSWQWIMRVYRQRGLETALHHSTHSPPAQGIYRPDQLSNTKELECFLSIDSKIGDWRIYFPSRNWVWYEILLVLVIYKQEHFSTSLLLHYLSASGGSPPHNNWCAGRPHLGHVYSDW
jgi:hypothetical protein